MDWNSVKDLLIAVMMVATGAGTFVAARKSSKRHDLITSDATDAKTKAEEALGLVVEQGIKIRDLEKELGQAKEHHADCEAKNRELKSEVDKLIGKVEGYKEQAQAAVPPVFEDLIRRVAGENAKKLDTVIQLLKSKP